MTRRAISRVAAASAVLLALELLLVPVLPDAQAAAVPSLRGTASDGTVAQRRRRPSEPAQPAAQEPTVNEPPPPVDQRSRRRRRSDQAQEQVQSAEDQRAQQARFREWVESLRARDTVHSSSEVGRLTDEAIERLLAIIIDFQSPETLRRLAEFYWKKGRRLVEEENLRHRAAYDEWMQSGAQGNEPQFDERAGDRYYSLSIDVALKIVEMFPNWSEIAEVYLFLGQTLADLRQRGEGIQYFERLVREFPEGRYTPNAWFAIGEYYFDEKNVYRAQEAYAEAVRFEDSPIWGFAVYKWAWTQFNLNDFDAAIESFHRVIDWCASQGEEQNSLREDALADLVTVYSESGREQEARAYFSRDADLQRRYWAMMLHQMATSFQNQGRLDDSVRLLRELIAYKPTDRRNPTFQMRIVDLYMNMNNRDGALEAILELVEYADPGNAWVIANREQHREDVRTAWETAEAQLIRSINEYHRQATELKTDDAYALAIRLYGLYDRLFQEAPAYYDLSFNFALLLYEQADETEKMWRDCRAQARRRGENPDQAADCVAAFDRVKAHFEGAGDQFSKVASLNQEGAHFEESSYNAIQAFYRIVNTQITTYMDRVRESFRGQRNTQIAETEQAGAREEEEEEGAQARTDELPPEFQRLEDFVDPLIRKFIDAAEVYIQHSSNTRYMVDVLYQAAILYYVHNWFPEAVGRFERIVNDYPEHRLAVFSANLILDSLNISRDYAGLNARARDYRNRTRLIQAQTGGQAGRNRFKQDLDELVHKSQFYICDQAGKEGHHEQAAWCFLAFVREFNTYRNRTGRQAPSELAPVPDQYSGRHFSGSQWLELRADEYKPADRFAPLGLNNSIFYFVRAGEIRSAVAVQREFLANFPDDARWNEIKWGLALNYQAMAYYELALQNFLEYYERFKSARNDPHVRDALFNAITYAIALGRFDDALRLRTAYMQLPATTDAERDEMRFSLAFVYRDASMRDREKAAYEDYLTGRRDSLRLPTRSATGAWQGVGESYCRGHCGRILLAWEGLLDIARANGDETTARRLLDQAFAFHQIPPERVENSADARALGARVLAEALFNELELRFDRYKAMTIQCPNYNPPWGATPNMARVEGVNRCIAQKLQEKMNEAAAMLDAYNNLIRTTRDPYWMVAAFYRQGTTMQSLSSSLFNATVPGWLTPIQQDIYFERLRERALPAEETALSGFIQARVIASNFGVYSPWSQRALAELQAARPSQFAPIHEVYEPRSYNAHALYSPGFNADEPGELAPRPELVRQPAAPAPVQPAAPIAPTPEPDNTDDALEGAPGA